MNLAVKNLVVHYGQAEALKDISIEVSQGALVSVIGANGAGKSTLLRTISGLLKPSKGEIWLNGQRLDGLKPDRIMLHGIAHCPEGRKLFPFMTTEENLRIGSFTLGSEQVKANLKDVYSRFPILKQRAKQKAGTLSGGEQQMLAVGRALMTGARFILLDEPTIGLAPRIVEELAYIFQDLCQQGMSILLVEQNAQVAFDLAEYVYVLEVGSVTIKGTPEELRNSEYIQRAYLGGVIGS